MLANQDKRLHFVRMLAWISVCLAAPLLDAVLVATAMDPEALPNPVEFFLFLIVPAAILNFLVLRTVFSVVATLLTQGRT